MTRMKHHFLLLNLHASQRIRQQQQQQQQQLTWISLGSLVALLPLGVDAVKVKLAVPKELPLTEK